MHLVGFIIRIYHDARSPDRQILKERSTAYVNDAAVRPHATLEVITAVLIDSLIGCHAKSVHRFPTFRSRLLATSSLDFTGRTVVGGHMQHWRLSQRC